MEAIDPRDAWVQDAFGISPSGAAAGPAAALDTAKMANRLSIMQLKIAHYARDTAQETDWLDRVEAAQDRLDANDAKGAAALIDALGAEMMAAAKRAQEAFKPLKRWQAAFDGCVAEAAGVKAAMVQQIMDIDKSVLPDFEAGWTDLEDELSGVGRVMETAFAKARKASAQDRSVLINKAAASAGKMIDGSTMLADIDTNDVQPAKIVATLRRELEVLSHAIEGA